MPWTRLDNPLGTTVLVMHWEPMLIYGGSRPHHGQYAVYDSATEKLKIVGKGWNAVSQHRFLGIF